MTVITDAKSRRPRHPKPTVGQNAGRSIRRVADIIDNRGWIQGAEGDKERGFCITGALRYGVREFSKFKITFEFLQNWFLKTHGNAIIGYNDARGRTKEEVLRALRQCSDELDPPFRQ